MSVDSADAHALIGGSAAPRFGNLLCADAEPAITLDEAILATYAGEYRQSEKRIVTVTREGAHLFIDIPRKGDRLELFASPKGDFFFKVTTTTRVRFVREGATVTGLEFTFGEGEEPIQAQKIR